MGEPAARRFLRVQLERLKAAGARIGAHPAFRPAMRYLQYALFALILGLVIWRLTQLGWADIAAHLPTAPAFYVFWALRFLALPVADMVAYGTIWQRPMGSHFPVFVRKRVYNYGVAGYSGEGFLILWASRTLGLTPVSALKNVKDGNILSAFTANVATLVLVAGLAVSGEVWRLAGVLPGGLPLFGLTFLVSLATVTVVVMFRRQLISVSRAQAGRILGVHGLRQVVQVTLMAAMYSAALPGVPFETWLLFAALFLVITRIPFLPSQDLAYMLGALSLASLTPVSADAIGGMLVGEAILAQAVNGVLFLATSYLARQRPARQG